MDKIDVAGLKIDALTKQQFLDQLDNRIKQGQKTFITTPYSEFLYAALRDKAVMSLINTSDIAIPDGIGVIWAQYFLSKPFNVEGYWGRVMQAWGQVVNTGAQILLNPKKLYQVFPEKLVGADMFWELSKWAADNRIQFI
jgi:UDP-N-acetyl-D-mannosaminuronic acid transferase (WecB/TagA/CpsF family)